MNLRRIVISGASAGIGAALARHLGNEGNNLVLAARRAEALNTVARVVFDPRLGRCEVTRHHPRGVHEIGAHPCWWTMSNLYRLAFGAQILFYRGAAVGWILRRSSEEVLAREISLHVLLIELGYS
jgi:short chain dehydrogenase